LGKKTKNVKNSENILQIFFRGIFLYIKNFFPFSIVMLFPVFGQVLGVLLIFAPVYFYRKYVLLALSGEQLQQNLVFLLLGLILILIPGFILFLNAFWEYLVAMISLNTLTADLVKKKSFGNFKTHNGAVNLRTKDYITLLFLLMSIWIIFPAIPFITLLLSLFFLDKTLSAILFGISLLICVILLVLASIYLSLSCQIFALEIITPFGALKKSFEMMKKHFWRGIILAILLFIFTGILIPVLMQMPLKNTLFMDYLVIPIEIYVKILSENPFIAGILEKIKYSVSDISREIAFSIISMLITSFMLPLGSICYTLFYLDIKKRKN